MNSPHQVRHNEHLVYAIIVFPNGKPAVGTLAVLIPAGHSATILNGQTLDDDPSYQRSVADRDGRVAFPGMEGAFDLIAIHPYGFARADSQALLHEVQIQLRAWAKVEGRFLIGTKPAVGLDMLASNIGDHPNESENSNLNLVAEATTDADGKFEMERVPAGKINITHQFKLKFHGINYAARAAEQRVVDAEPGHTAYVNFGGGGHTLVGIVTLPKELIGRKDWEFSYAALTSKGETAPLPLPSDIADSSFAIQQEWYQQFVATAAGKAFIVEATNQQVLKQRYLLNISSTGAFRVEDVPPGLYALRIEARGMSPTLVHGTVIASGQYDFFVPKYIDGSRNKPLEIPDVRLMLHRPVDVARVGEPAPDFDADTFDGSHLNLANYRGRIVLLEFWASWCGPCISAVPRLKSIYKRYGKCGKFVMLSLSIDDTRLAAKNFVDQHDMSWIQGFVASNSETMADYGVDEYGVPSIWLIDPDRKIILRPVVGENISELLEKTDAALTEALVKCPKQ